jgi:enterochelin esterase-like enzyme
MKALIAGALLALVATPAAAQNITAPPPPIPDGITVEEIKVHGPRWSATSRATTSSRQVMVVLPPSYRASPNKRYPVVYYLHGFAIDGKNFYNYMHVPEAVGAQRRARSPSSSSSCRAR